MMTEQELAALVDQAERASVTQSGDFNKENEDYLKYYLCEPFGDEVDGRSKVISTDVLDLVESDMPSLARVFLGAGDPVEFTAANPMDPLAVQEAKDKQALVAYLIRTCPDSFRTQHGWLKASELQSVAPLEYGIEEVSCTKTKRYKGINAEELAALMVEIEDEEGVKSVTISEQEDYGDETYSISLVIEYVKQQYFLRNIPVEDLIASRNAWNKNDAAVIGKRFRKTRSDLVAEGFSYDLVNSLPSADVDDDSTLKQVRYKDQGGEEYDSPINAWANEEVKGTDVYIKCDYDGDGIAERRHVIKVGNVILVNEAFDHVPYAFISSMLMPNNLIGRPRAELAMQYQRVNSTLRRQVLDNVYQVNNPRNVTSDAVDMDDYLDIRLGGAIRVDDKTAQGHVIPLTVPYIGDKALQVITYMDSARAQTTGSLMANQGLEADNLHKETATRFEGMEAAATAKIELVCRAIAETGYRDLWEGIAWFANHYQNTETEVHVLGREMVIDPRTWKYDHHLSAAVGTGAGDDEKTMQNMSGLFNIQTALMQEGSPLADDRGRYNTLKNITKVMGKNDIQSYFNNPEEPQQVTFAENRLLRQQVQQMQEMLQNPLAEAETVKAQGRLQLEQMQQKFNAQLEQFKQKAKNDEQLQAEIAKYQADLRELQYKYTELTTKTGFDYTKLEVENSVDVPNEGMGQ